MPYFDINIFTAGQVVEEDEMNKIRADLRYVHGDDGSFQFVAPAGFAHYTTSQRDSLRVGAGTRQSPYIYPHVGAIIWNTSVGQIEIHIGQGTWIASVLQTLFQRITSSSTWTKPSGISWVFAEIIGGGAGGGRSGTSRTGGFPGRFMQKLFRAIDLANSISCTIGAGGLGTQSSTGSVGNDTIFGSLIALGGSTSSGSISRSLLPPGAGGSSTGPSIPGIGLNAIPSSGSDGQDGPEGTGTGGGRNTAGNGGNGGIPGGGGGLYIGSGGFYGGNGARGEIRIWAW